MKTKRNILEMVNLQITFFLILALTANICLGTRTYTLDEDFDEGVLVGVEYDTVPDQLQLSEEIETLPFIWVPNMQGTVSKIDTETGKELARYRVVPPGLPVENGSPSRTTVDLEGNCWVGNRAAGTVVKIGSYEAGSWIDRNGNGTCETSQDTNGDGDITGSELLPWGEDECVLYEVVLIPGSEGTYAPGTYAAGSPPVWQPSGGHFGGALEFNGLTGYVELPIGQVISSLDSATFATWVYISNTGLDWQRIFDFGSSTEVNMFLTPNNGNTGTMRFAITTSGNPGEDRVTAPDALSTGWHHVAVTIDPNTILLYIDGVEVDSNTATTLTPSDLGETSNNWLGKSQYPADPYFNGSIDDFRIYDCALDAGNIGVVMSGAEPELPALLVGYWQLDESSGDIASDSSVNINHGQLTCDTGSPPVWQPSGGHDGAGALEFDGIAGYVELPIGQVISSLNSATFATWVDYSNAGGYWQRIFDFGNSTSVNMFLTPNNGTMRFAITTSGAGGEAQVIMPYNNPALETGWHHVAITIDADNDTMCLYIDGIEVNSTPTTLTPSDLGETSNNWLGKSQYPADPYFNGSIDDFRIYNCALDDTAIDALYIGGEPELTALVGHWQLDESSGNIASDSSVNSNHGWLLNGDLRLYEANKWGWASPRGLAIDASNNLWVGTWNKMTFHYIDGATGTILDMVDVSYWDHHSYGAVIDENGVLWSSGQEWWHVLRFDPSTNPPTIDAVSPGHFVYGLGLDYLGHLFVSGWESRYLSRVDITDTTDPIDWSQSKDELFQARGVACTSDNDVWVASTYNNMVYRYDNNGVLKASIFVGYGPTGVAVDSAGKVWACNLYDENIVRIDPATNTVDLTKTLINSEGQYTYSDMTGIVVRNISTKIGNWTVIHDAGNEVPWGKVSWNSNEPAGTLIRVEVRSSNDQIVWSDWELADNDVMLSQTPDGQYLQIKTTSQILEGEVSPILYDLTVMPSYTAVTYDGDTLVSTEGNPTADVDLIATLRDDLGTVVEVDDEEIEFTLTSEGVETVVATASTVDGVASAIEALSPAIYDVEVTVTSSGLTTKAILVVYNPDGGFATGGGWIVPEDDSENTYPNHRANFGFNAKYKQDAPTGHIEFRYSDGYIDLKSTSIELLVITGSKIVQFKGYASVNGEEGNWFFVKAIDNGEPGVNDTFDIKIWAPGVDPEGDPTERAGGVLQGGNIKVHTN